MNTEKNFFSHTITVYNRGQETKKTVRNQNTNFKKKKNSSFDSEKKKTASD